MTWLIPVHIIKSKEVSDGVHILFILHLSIEASNYLHQNVNYS